MAPSLKYWPNEKLPSISKNVSDRSFPTSSMSGVRKHFCTVVVSGAGGSRQYGIWGCIPAVVSSVEWSSARGTSDAEGTRRCPLSSKNETLPQLRRRPHGWILRAAPRPTRARRVLQAGGGPSVGA